VNVDDKREMLATITTERNDITSNFEIPVVYCSEFVSNNSRAGFFLGFLMIIALLYYKSTDVNNLTVNNIPR